MSLRGEPRRCTRRPLSPPPRPHSHLPRRIARTQPNLEALAQIHRHVVRTVDVDFADHLKKIFVHRVDRPEQVYRAVQSIIVDSIAQFEPVQGEPGKVKKSPPFDGYWVGNNWMMRLKKLPK